MELILASQSPRRHQLLGLFGLPFAVRVADIDETMDPIQPPCEEVARVSRRKALAVARQADDIVIAADTIVVCDDKVLGKPHTREEAEQMLTLLSGRDHQVMTGLTVLRGENIQSVTEITAIHFRPLSKKEIAAYVATGEPMDKAGAYGIQGGAALFAEKMVGDYYNRDGVRGVVISSKSVCPDRNYKYYNCGVDMLISLTEEGNAQWASDKNFGTLFKKDIPCKNKLGLDFLYEDDNPQNKISKIENWRAKYPAFDKAAHGNWHLPSRKCLDNYVFPRLTPINNTLRRLSAQEIKPNRKYWSCEECGSDSAFAVDSKEFHYYPKSDVMAVRSVYPFKVSMSATDIENEKIWRNLGLVPCQEGLTDDPTTIKEYNEYWKFLTDSKEDDQKPSDYKFDIEAFKDLMDSILSEARK